MAIQKKSSNIFLDKIDHQNEKSPKSVSNHLRAVDLTSKHNFSLHFNENRKLKMPSSLPAKQQQHQRQPTILTNIIKSHLYRKHRYNHKYDGVICRNRSSSMSRLKSFTANRGHNALSGEESSQSSLNLSASSGYLSGSSANSSVGGSNLNLSIGINGVTTNGITSNGITSNGGSLLNKPLVNNGNGLQSIQSNGISETHSNGQFHVHINGTTSHHLSPHQQQQQLPQSSSQLPTLSNMAATASRRRTISSNSNG